jgi:hypothetical protein
MALLRIGFGFLMDQSVHCVSSHLARLALTDYLRACRLIKSVQVEFFKRDINASNIMASL